MVISKLTFRRYKQADLQRFDELLLKHQFTNMTNFTKLSSKHFEADKNGLGKCDEVEYSYSLNDVPSELTHQRNCASLAELTVVLHNYQKEMKTSADLENTAFVSFTLLKDDGIFPGDFSLLNVLPLKRAVMGNIYKQYCFNPVFPVTTVKNGALQRFLQEQKGLDNFTPKMVALFEHDQESFSVFFNDFYGTCPRVIELKVPYSSIRRIIANTAHIKDNIHCKLYFQLAFPPFIHPRREQMNENSGDKFYVRERYPTWNPKRANEMDIRQSSCLLLRCEYLDGHHLLDCFGKLRKLTGLDIEFRSIRGNPFVKHCFYEKNWLQNSDLLPENLKKIQDAKYFPLLYAVEALVNRGGEIYDYFFRKPYICFEAFMTFVIGKYEHDFETEPDKPITRTVRALEIMHQKLDQLLDVPEPIAFFLSLYDQPEFEAASELTQKLLKNGFMRVRKIVVTPTRVIYCNPEIVMGNRALRMVGSDYMINITFRDENSSKLFGIQKIMVTKTVENFLKTSKVIGMRTFSYLGSSDSQMHDHGCYLFAGTREDVIKFREKCGNFSVEAIPKMMSHFGQCFAQSRNSSLQLDHKDFCETPDYSGGSDSNGNPYIFSNGVGIMSTNFAQTIAEDIGQPDYVPSCISFQFRGYKGILVQNSQIDQIPPQAIIEPNDSEVRWHNKKVVFRPSQKTFDAQHENSFEVLNVSKPLSVTLNKPLINLLDQVAEKQDTVLHTRIKNRILTLLENDIESMFCTLDGTDSAYSTLAELSKLIPYQLFKDFPLMKEPFFRSLLRASSVVRLHRLIGRMKINLPASQSRMMFGVIDESGYLKPGQVFVQYTVDVNTKFPSKTAEKATVTGPVMVSKKSAILPGDIRMVEAVDIEALHELVDVIVFPKNGDRPLPLEISPSNLHGDEFIVIWDPELLLHHGEEPFDYTAAITETPKESEDPHFVQMIPDLMIDCFKNFIFEDAIGTISNSHLANSDLFGIDSELCSNIAVKHNLAVNFQVTGISPDHLTKQWSEDAKMPPEKVERYPNFMRKTVVSPSYKSGRLLGKLHDRLSEVEGILKASELVPEESSITIDQSFVISGDEIYSDEAVMAYTQYSSLIQNLLDSYGITNEGKLFSSHFGNLKRRLSDREDNSTGFTTTYMIQEQLANIYEKFRLQFFEKGGGIEQCAEIDGKYPPGVREAFSRVCKLPCICLRKKASAYYRVAYSGKNFLSFAWLVADVLMVNRRTFLGKCSIDTDDANNNIDGLLRTKTLDKTLGDTVCEGKAYVIELPLEANNYEELLWKLAMKCGCEYLAYKKKYEPRVGLQTFRVILQPLGTHQNIMKFNNILLPVPKMDEPDFQVRSNLLAADTYKKIVFYTQDENSIGAVYP